MIFTTNKEGVRAIQATKQKNMAGKFTRARTPFARKQTNRVFESKDVTTSMKCYKALKDTTFGRTIC